MLEADRLREQAAAWYSAKAAEFALSGGGACEAMFRLYAERIRNGDADHRLDAVLAGQAEYDA